MEVIGSNPIAPTILNLPMIQPFGSGWLFCSLNFQPDASPMESLGLLRSGLHPQQLLHVHALSVQRLPKVPGRVDRRGIRFGMTSIVWLTVMSFVVSFAHVLRL